MQLQSPSSLSPAEQQPGRDGDVVQNDRTRNGTKHEACGDDHGVEQCYLLEDRGVGNLHENIGAQDDGERGGQRVGSDQPSSEKHAAERKIKLDLDDGVKVNYAKFTDEKYGEILAEVKAICGTKDEE